MLDVIKDYIIQNWTWLLPIFVSVVEFIFLIIFRRKSFVIQDYDIVSELKTYINQAEFKFGHGHGNEKIRYVLNLFSQNHGSWSFKVLRIVEDMLSTPQKKGGN